MNTPARHLIFHGTIVLLFGLLCGGPYASAIKRQAAAHIVHSWRVAHASLPMGATVMLAVGALLSHLAGGAALHWFIAVSLIVSSYAFCFSLPLAALAGHRGLSSGGPLSARLVFAGNLLGAWASGLAAAALVYAAYVSL
ncbi:hypothetical protein [Polaromonas sp. A23]|uniref:hypothetical protein n=1 Tax=Polaromonas sp. A23 TaxID=1944133 RepID=UPI000985760D|nr:hypothetical protein [Polaromonas sp. A23]OOG37203.1 hypothetical protein B0B52_18790 [Polaromonas sp. A23]